MMPPLVVAFSAVPVGPYSVAAGRGPNVRRPIATVLLTLGLALAGIAAYFVLPVSPLPQVDFPTISVRANLPGASPETMATSVATPLERRLGVIAGVTEMTSSSGTGSTRITLQFDPSRAIDGAARIVDPIIHGINSGQHVWGQFLKDYKPTTW